MEQELIDAMDVLARLSRLEDKSYMKKYMNGGLSYRDLVGVDNELAMFLSRQITIMLMHVHVAAGNEDSAKKLLEDHNKFCAELMGDNDGPRVN